MQRPNIAWINITERCNNRCVYCYAKDSLHERRRVIPLEKVKKIVDKLLFLKIERCILMGGEPTLHPDVIEIFKYVLNKGMGINMISNGTRFADEAFCRSFIDAGLGPKGTVVFSMHASSNEDSLEIAGSRMYFSLFLKGLQNLLKYNIKPGINITISKVNKDKVFKMMDLLKASGIKNIHFNLGSPSVSSNVIDASHVLSFEELSKTAEKIYNYGKMINLRTRFLFLAPFCILPKKLYKQMRREDLIEAGCSVRTGSGLTVNIDGDIVPCNHLLEFPIIKSGTFNNIVNKPGYVKIMDYPKMKNLRKSVNVYRLKECKMCKEFYLCQGGGCPLFWLNKNITNNFYKW